MARLWFSIAVLFLATQASSGIMTLESYMQQICDDAENCVEDGKGEELCKISFLPATEEELNSYCPYIIRIMWCAAKSIFIWTPPSNSINNFINSGFNLWKVMCEICTNGSQLRKEYLDGISCFKDLILDGSTFDNFLLNGQQTMKSLNPSIEGASKEEMQLNLMCMSTFYGLASLVVETEKSCGKTVRNMANEMFQRVKPLTLLNCSETNMHASTMKFLDANWLDRKKASIFISLFKS
ncbi:uncharacterized protein LOC129984634 [Argiope bruennichi]|uniref:uncharacterized protein LOC129984634 n=1 Tax=Argiope bruennichi TaxID=94029 RepID=UPI002495279E|nr:uncharacterized protein LOC129984634 [Argiope bruennichi]